jgi:N-acyl-D-aspartate/D-glutamate deacylase
MRKMYFPAMSNKSPKLLRLMEVVETLRVPGAKKPLSSQSLYSNYLEALDIIPVNAEGKAKTRHNEVSYITEQQAEHLRLAFKVRNWRKIKRAQEGKP